MVVLLGRAGGAGTRLRSRPHVSMLLVEVITF
jgi:hypothetical protein